MNIRGTILSKISAFCTQHGLGRSAFGQQAVGDRKFIRQLERGEPVTLGRIEKAEQFMAGFRAEDGREIGAPAAADESGEAGDSTRPAGAADVDDGPHAASPNRAPSRRLREAVSQ